MRRITLLISIGLLVVVYLTLNILFAQNPPTAAAISDLERPIHACEQQVASWRREERVEIAFVVAVIVFGVIISSLHALNDNWARKTTLALGVATAILTGINSRIFTADDRTLRRATFEGNGVISQLWVMADTMKDEHVCPQDKLNVKGDYLKKLLEFQAIGERLNGTANAPANASASNRGMWKEALEYCRACMRRRRWGFRHGCRSLRRTTPVSITLGKPPPTLSPVQNRTPSMTRSITRCCS